MNVDNIVEESDQPGSSNNNATATSLTPHQLAAINTDIDMARRSPEMAMHVALDHGPQLVAEVERLREEVASRETGCRCTIETGCGEGRDAGCEWCANADIYDPCPVFGFMCDPECGNPEEPCCTEWQQANTRAFEQRATELRECRAERDAALAVIEQLRAKATLWQHAIVQGVLDQGSVPDLVTRAFGDQLAHILDATHAANHKGVAAEPGVTLGDDESHYACTQTRCTEDNPENCWVDHDDGGK